MSSSRPVTPSVAGATGPGRRLSTFFFHRHPRSGSARCSAAPLGWLLIGYLGSLFVLLLAAFWDTNTFTAEIVHTFTLDNFRQIFEQPVYREVAWRTIKMAALVTVADARARVPDRVLHGAGRVAADAQPPRRRRARAAVGELPREGVRVAHDPVRQRRHQLGARPARALVRRLLDRRALARVHVPLAAVHDPARSTRGSSGSPARCSRRPPTSAAARCGRSSG